MNAPKENHAEQNARAWYETIAALVAALECDFTRLEELREERAALVADRDEDLGAAAVTRALAQKALERWDAENGDELRELTESATVDGETFADADAVRERIQEAPLSVQVRGDWRDPGESQDKPSEFEILLTTGGPVLRIRGELNEHCEPRRAWLEYQDWGTPWAHYFAGEGSGEVLVAFASCFYFGE